MRMMNKRQYNKLAKKYGFIWTDGYTSKRLWNEGKNYRKTMRKMLKTGVIGTYTAVDFFEG